MNPAGEAVLIFGFNGIRASVRPAGGEFERPEWGGVRLSQEGVEGASPDVAIDAPGDIVAVWQQHTGPHPRIYAATKPAGGSFGLPVPVSPEAEEASAPAVGVNRSGETTVVWLANDGTSEVVQAARASLAGGYGSPTNLSGDGADASDPRVVVDPAGDTVVSWTRGGDADVARRLAGGSFPAPYPDGNGEVLGELAPSTSPRVVIDQAGEALAEWKAPTGSVRTMRQPVGAPAFGSGETLASTTGLPSAAINEAGEAVAAWPSSHGIQVATAAPRVPFGAAVELPSTFTASAAQVAMSASGDASVEWEASDAHGSSREGSVVTRSGSFARPTGLFTSETVTAGSLVMASDAAGDTIGVWNTGPPLEDMESMAYDNGPTVTGLSLAERGVVGQTLPFSIQPPLSVWRSLNAVTWNFGDGSTASGLSVSHAYAAPGTYIVTVTATDTQHTGFPGIPPLFPEYVGDTLTAAVTVSQAASSLSPERSGPAPSSATEDLTSLSIRPNAFLANAIGPSAVASESRSAHQRGATVAFTLTLPGTVTFTVKRSATGIRRGKKCVSVTFSVGGKHTRHCSLLHALGHFARNGTAGSNRFHITGRLDGKSLAPGRYLLIGSSDGTDQPPRQITFRILRR
jgi:PKD domain